MHITAHSADERLVLRKLQEVVEQVSLLDSLQKILVEGFLRGNTPKHHDGLHRQLRLLGKPLVCVEPSRLVLNPTLFRMREIHVLGDMLAAEAINEARALAGDEACHISHLDMTVHHVSKADLPGAALVPTSRDHHQLELLEVYRLIAVVIHSSDHRFNLAVVGNHLQTAHDRCKFFRVDHSSTFQVEGSKCSSPLAPQRLRHIALCCDHRGALRRGHRKQRARASNENVTAVALESNWF
mmetsp:Transcript_87506/g.252673  ORF Transcript_87506/g.252673 Transcript_87506/m.252673 type:complete len:240 (+) Transcript_87506:446-1165(+)